MRPIFKVLADSQNITAFIQQRLLSLTINHESEDRADTATIVLSNAPPHLEPPRTGAKLEIQLGFIETGLSRPLSFTIDELQYTGPPFSLTIRGRSVNLTAPIKSHRERSWENTTFKHILHRIAGEHGYDFVIEDGIADFNVNYYLQSHSDFTTLGELALDNLGADVCVQILQNKIVVAKRGVQKSLKSQMPLPCSTISAKDIIQYRITTAERGKYTKVIAQWYDTHTAETRQAIAGSGEPAFLIQRTFTDALEAQRAAEGQLQALKQGIATLHASITAHPAVLPQASIELVGLPPGASGIWSLSSVTHKLDGSGLSSDIVAKSSNALSNQNIVVG